MSNLSLRNKLLLLSLFPLILTLLTSDLVKPALN